MAVGDIFRLAIVGSGGSDQLLVNVLHYKQLIPLLTDPGAVLVECWQNDAEELYTGCFGEQNSIDAYQVRGVTDPTYGFDFVLDEPIPGGLGGEAYAPQDAPVITWQTNLIGRSFRGRSYMWPITESHSSGGVISSGLRSNLNAFADAAKLISPLLSVIPAFGLVVWSPTLAIATDVTRHQVRDTLKTMRKRQAGVGA